MSQRSMQMERDGWILMQAVSPKQAALWIADKRDAMGDPEFPALYLEPLGWSESAASDHLTPLTTLATTEVSSLSSPPQPPALASPMIEQVTLERSNMDPSTSHRDDTSQLQAEMASDEAGCLYDTRTRPMFDYLAGQADARRLEVFPALRWCAYRIQRFMQAEADRYGLTDGAARVLMRLKHAEEQPLGALAAGMHVSPKNITLLMDQLEKDGLVLRVPDPADRRSVRARLTDEGQRLVGEFLREFMTHSLELVEDLPREDLERVRHVALLLVRRIEARLAPANRNDPSSVAPTRSR